MKSGDVSYLDFLTCWECELNGQSLCLPRGSDSPDVTIVGESPGPHENRYAKVFIGQAGKLLEQIVENAKLNGKVRYINVVGCFPGRDGKGKIAKPPQEVVDRCHHMLVHDLLLHTPKVIVCMGADSIRYFTGVRKVTDARKRTYYWPSQRSSESGLFSDEIATRYKDTEGKYIESKAIPVFATYHPSAALYGDDKKKGRIQSFITSDILKAASEAVGAKREIDYWLIDSIDELSEYVGQVIELYNNGELRFITVDIEATGVNFISDDLVGVAIGTGNGQAVFVVWDHKQSRNHGDPGWHEAVRSLLSRLFSVVPVSNHNLKFDYKWLLHYGMKIATVYHDTMLSSWWLDASHTPKGLDELAALHLGVFSHKEEMHGALAAAGAGPKDYSKLKSVDLQVLTRYACADADVTYGLTLLYEKRLEEQGVMDGYKRFALDRIPVMADIEMSGVKVDLAVLTEASREYEESGAEFISWVRSSQLGKLFVAFRKKERAIIQERVDLAIQNDSRGTTEYRKDLTRLRWFKKNGMEWKPSMISEMLYDVAKVPPHEQAITVDDDGNIKLSAKKEYRGHYKLYCIDRAEKAESDQSKKWWNLVREFITRYDAFSKDNKLYTSYVKPIPTHVTEDGRVHPDFGIGGTDSERDNCRDPSLHTIPKKGRIKDAFVPFWELGLIMNADYAQAEVRVLTSLSADQDLHKALCDGLDIHTYVASQLFNVDYNDVTTDQRNIGKNMCFGLIYGITAYGIAVRNQITEDAAQVLVDKFFARFPGIKRYVESQHELLDLHGYVWNLTSGRRRPVPMIESRNHKDREKAQRVAVNSPIQGTASGIAADSITRMHREYTAREMRSKIYNFTHDSAGTIIYPDINELFEIAKIHYHEMVEVPPIVWPWLTAPLAIDYELGVTWGHLVDVKFEHESRSLVVTGKKVRTVPLVKRMSMWDGFTGVECLDPVHDKGELIPRSRIIF